MHVGMRWKILVLAYKSRNMEGLVQFIGDSVQGTQGIWVKTG